MIGPDLPPPRPLQELRQTLAECRDERRRGIAEARERVDKATGRTRRYHVAGSSSCEDEDNCAECAREKKEDAKQ